jgi:O-antigen ligase
MMKQLDSILEGLMFGLLMLVLLASPWLFGAWEMWWFWPFAVTLFLATGCFAVRLMLSAGLGDYHLAFSKTSRLAIAAYLPFLIYALVRALQAGVHMDAERSFLLHLTPFLIGLMIVVGVNDQRRQVLILALTVNFLLLGVYGIANDLLAGNARVLWVPGFPQYQGSYPRATGSYFCPDHFAGLMELGLAAGLALLLHRSASWRLRLGMVPLIGVVLWGILLTKSRGAGLVTGILLALALWWGTAPWPRRTRWISRGTGLALLALAIVLFASFGGHYVKRFKDYPWTRFEHSDRYQMSAAALRGWLSAPVWGIGPGMHQNLWPHFAASSDGDRERGIRPRFMNNTFHSFEAHNDWAQLLEEYGAVGLALFLLAAGTGAGVLYRGWRRYAEASESPAREAASDGKDWTILTALLATAAMAGHSIGDFNLQIPSTTWILAALVGLALAQVAGNHQRFSGRRRRHEQRPAAGDRP